MFFLGLLPNDFQSFRGSPQFYIKADVRAQPKTSTSWGGLKRFRVKGAFLKSPLPGPGQAALVAPAGVKSPACLKQRSTLPKKLKTNRFVSI